jgi:ectoine hydroxylase-related dioxygenase (phytanoyl-CoA dioxygenase family)
MIESLTPQQVEAFDRDGFLILEEGLVSEKALQLLRERYERLFDGEYETGVKPDEVNWVPGRDPEDRTRQLCNAWKSDNVVAAQVLSERNGRLAAQLAGYRGVRILQDNVLWKPPATKAIGFHQDSSYADYLVPPEMITCWVALDDTAADAGPVEYVRGSNQWPKSPPERSEFHAPEDWLAGPRAAIPESVELEIVPVVVKAGGGSFHHGLTWHGSAPKRNAAVARRALVSHLLPVEVRFHETNVDLIYSRYRRRGDLSLDESFFPVVWDESGYRTP